MSRYTLLPFTLMALSIVVRADYFSKDPLVDKVVPYDSIPYRVMTDTDDPRGSQTGYNICNSTTENQDSLCQTMFMNHIDDWCLWAPAPPNSQAMEPVYSLPALSPGLQFIQTPSYIQVAGTINQALLNIAGATGGELDSGGQDGEGNPMGGLVYSNSFASNNRNNGTYQQAQHWSFFIGGTSFCGKVCDSAGKNPGGLCNNVYDRLGCEYNAPNDAQEGVFEKCDGDDMTPVGIYVGADGVTSTYKQPASENDDLGVLPYTPKPAPSSKCVPYPSAALFADGAAITSAAGSASATGTGSTAAATGKTTAKNTASGSAPTSTLTGTGTGKNGAASVGVSAGAIAIALFAMLAQS
ncbi:hypothetical protein C8J56DRAFT_1007087 [Mycena floridula]|nr:hypothetical protein C8J56DRAFT_1007087 [Mycena floridula]